MSSTSAPVVQAVVVAATDTAVELRLRAVYDPEGQLELAVAFGDVAERMRQVRQSAVSDTVRKLADKEVTDAEASVRRAKSIAAQDAEVFERVRPASEIIAFVDSSIARVRRRRRRLIVEMPRWMLERYRALRPESKQESAAVASHLWFRGEVDAIRVSGIDGVTLSTVHLAPETLTSAEAEVYMTLRANGLAPEAAEQAARLV